MEDVKKFQKNSQLDKVKHKKSKQKKKDPIQTTKCETSGSTSKNYSDSSSAEEEEEEEQKKSRPKKDKVSQYIKKIKVILSWKQ